MDPIWKELPLDLSERVCNALTKVRRIDATLANEIKNQWHKYNKWYYNYVALFGIDNVLYVMYDDMKNVCGAVDDYPDEMDFETVVQTMWTKLSHEDRDDLLNDSSV